MELRHLRYFAAVADAENVSRAALKLHVSQPALSRQIRDLEAELGVALFERTPKSLRLTNAGRALLPGARTVLEEAEKAVRIAQDAGRGSGTTLEVGYAATPTVRLLPTTLRIFQQRHPSIHVRLHDLSTDAMLSGLREGHLHIALLICSRKSRLRGLASEELLRMEPRLAVAPDHPLAKLPSVSLDQLATVPLLGFSAAEYPEYHEILAQILGIPGAGRRLAMEHDSAASLMAAVESGAGVAIVTESMGCVAGPRLRLLPLRPRPAPFLLVAAWPSRPPRAATSAFLKSAREAAQGS